MMPVNRCVTYLIIVMMFMACNIDVTAQNADSVQNQTSQTNTKKRSAARASLYSAIVPGAGQVYNRKYWKVPIVYAGMGTFTYLSLQYQNEFTRYKSALLKRQNGEQDEFYGLLSDEAIENEMDRWHRLRDLNIIGATLFYVLQIIDANVDASLSDFDVSDDLSLVVKPLQTPTNHSMTLCLSYKF
ncbi:MAG: DUF5683 domain-containing protein [Bacteroidota bacterium]|nr:DUF5683 domain-containing protein [Bacteroidota bacterium]